MIDRLQRAQADKESGFTLVELLVVIAILGILSAVVVFAVGGIKDKGQTSACKIDTQTLQTAEEAFFAQPPPDGGQYTAQDPGPSPAANGLVPKFLSAPPTYHKVTTADGSSYAVVSTDTAKCP